MIGDVRAARIINSTMFSVLAVLALASSIWFAVTDFPYVRAIYMGLSLEDRRHLTAFLSSVWLFLLFGSFVARWVLTRLSHLKTSQAHS